MCPYCTSSVEYLFLKHNHLNTHLHYNTVGENIIATIKMRNIFCYTCIYCIFLYCSTFSYRSFNYCDSKSCALNLCLNFCMSFADWFMASFLYCFPYSYRSSNYCDSNSCRSFTLLMALAKSNGNLIAIARKCENITIAIVGRVITL